MREALSSCCLLFASVPERDGPSSSFVPDVFVRMLRRAHTQGAGGFPAWGIPPGGTLLFEIEVLAIAGK